MLIQDVLEKSVAYLKSKTFISSPRLEAEWLISAGLNLNRMDLYLKYDQPLKDSELNICRDYLKRRAQGEPVAYILGYKDFYNYRFKVTKDVLIPRPETEHLVEEALKCIQKKKIKILDIGCGSGCIGLSLLKLLPESDLLAVDLSEAALDVAKQNAQDLEVSDRVHFVCIDFSNLGLDQMQNAFLGQFDLIVANPPYIDRADKNLEKNVLQFEPNMALFADENGMSCIYKWTNYALPLLKQEGLFLMEIGYNQKDQAVDFWQATGQFKSIQTKKDYSGYHRVLYGEKNG